MSIDLLKLKYRIRVKDGNGDMYTITDAVYDSANLEENDGEVAARLTMTIKDKKVNGRWLRKVAYLGNYIYVHATVGNGWKEVFRGRIYDYDPSAHDRSFTIVCFDLNYRYQSSEVNIYRRKNETGAQLTRRLISRWKNRKITRLDGPHRRLPSKSYDKHLTVTDIIEDCIKESKKKGEPEYVIHCLKGEIAVIQAGTNKDVYTLSLNEELNNNHSIRDLVTRVRIYRTNEKNLDAKAKLSSTIDGKTKYGVLQRVVYTEGKSLKEAKKEANETLKEQGKVKKSRTVKHPDIPFIKKGDLVRTHGYAFANKKSPGKLIVKSVNHDIKSLSMEIKT